MRPIHALAAFAALFAPLAAQAKDKSPISLAKSSKWEINYDEDSCHLLARFGEGKQSAIIRITRYQPGDWFDLSIYGPPFKSWSSTMPVKIGFGVFAPITREALTGSSGNNVPLLIFTGMRLDNWTSSATSQEPPAVTPALEGQANAIDLTISGGKYYRLETGSLGTPMQAMRTCVIDLVRKWGYDPSEQAALQTLAIPLKSPATWVGSADYPTSALMQGHHGLVQFRLDIDASGAVTGCFVLHRTNPDDFADLTCKLIRKRAKFSPALDKDGRPARSYFISKVRFMIPD